MKKKEMLDSYYTIRKIIGILGLLLPVVVFTAHEGVMLSSISHYYYTKSAVFFIAILSSFGFFLISYRGYEKEETEKISDNTITHIGGFAVLLLVLIPTACICKDCDMITVDFSNGFPLYGHENKLIGSIHLVSAGIFLFSMGWMSIYKFTKGKTTKNHAFYKVCGYTVWICIGILFIEFVMEKILDKSFRATLYDVFILETIAIISFGSSWLVKGKALKDIHNLKNKVLLKFIKS